MAGNAPRHSWHLRQLWHCAICKLQNLKDAQEFESHSAAIRLRSRYDSGELRRDGFADTMRCRVPTGSDVLDRHQLDSDARWLNDRQDSDPMKEDHWLETSRRSSCRARLRESDVPPLACVDAPLFLMPSSAPRS